MYDLTWDLGPLFDLVRTLAPILAFVVLGYAYQKFFTELSTLRVEEGATEPCRAISIEDDLARRDWQQYEDRTRQRLLQRVDGLGFCHACETVAHGASAQEQAAPKSNDTAEQEFIHHRFRALELSVSRGCVLCGMFLDSVIARQVKQSEQWQESCDQIAARLRLRNSTAAVRVDLTSGRMWYRTKDPPNAFPLEIFRLDEEELHRLKIGSDARRRDYISFICDILHQDVRYAVYPSFWARLRFRVERMCSVAKRKRHGDDLGRLNLLARHIDRYPSSDACFDLAKSWIRRCTVGHPRCRQEAAADQRPRRLLRIEQDQVCLLENDEIIQAGPYAILSYCWGSTQSLQTTAENLRSHRRGIDISSLPQTLQDAVIVAQKLGIGYIWIDALCILQDSKADWEAECTKMGSYYKNAVLTISALDADTAQSGFLQPRPRECMSPLRPGDTGHLWVRRRRRDWHEIFAGASLNTRAWALQERLLSTRVLHFSSHELLWECLTSCAREGSHEENTTLEDSAELVHSEGQDFKRCLVTRGPDPFSRRDGAYDLWYRLVRQYSRRLLTRPSDRLAAIEGLGRRVGELAGTEYISGMFKDDLASLCWSPTARYDTTASCSPNWSWASTTGEIRYPFREYTAVRDPADAKFVAHQVDGNMEAIQLECHFRAISHFGKTAPTDIYDSQNACVGQLVGFLNSDARFEWDSLVATRICTRKNEARMPQLYLHNKKRPWVEGNGSRKEEECSCRGPSREEVVYFLILARWKESQCWGRVGLGQAAGAGGCLVDENRVPFVPEGRMVFKIGGHP